MAERELAPDRVVWTLGVRAADDDPRVAFSRVAARAGEVAAALQGTGEVTTGRVTVMPRERRRGQAMPKQEARADVVVSAPVERAGEAAAAAMDAGADDIRGPVARTGDTEGVRDALLAEAVQAARRRAEGMAAAAGRRLGRALAIRDHDIYEPWSGEVEDGVYGVAGMAMSRTPEPPVKPAAQVVRASVQVVFELVD